MKLNGRSSGDKAYWEERAKQEETHVLESNEPPLFMDFADYDTNYLTKDKRAVTRLQTPFINRLVTQYYSQLSNSTVIRQFT
jgi:hypothetical protein